MWRATVAQMFGSMRSAMQAARASRFEEGWLAWELCDIRPVKHAPPVCAARGIYDVDFSG